MERKRAIKNIAGHVFFMIFSLALYFLIIPAQVKVSQWNAGAGFTAQTFPRLLAVVIAGVSAIGLIRELILLARLPADSREEGGKTDWRAAAAPVLLTVLAIIYYLLFQRIGFIVATAIAIPAFLAALRCRKWQYYLYVYLFSGFIYVIFVYVLKIMLP